MGKFNGADGVNFERTIPDIANDYARFLLEKNVIDQDTFHHYVNEGQHEVLDILLGKLYETEDYKGQKVNTLDSFYHYCRFVVKEYRGQKVWNRFVKEMFLVAEYHKDSAIMASRSIGKSFFLYSLYPSYKQFLYKGTKFVHISNIPMQCIENLRVLKELIDTNEMLYQKKEVWKGKELKWTERQIEYNGGMLVTVTAGTSPKGLHVHFAIIDDILTEESQLNDEEIENYIFGQVYPTVQRMKGRMIISGTPLHQKDIYHLIMGDKQNFEGNLIRDGRMSAKGFFSKMFPIMDDDENPLLPEIYSREEIEAIRNKQGELKFQREYMLNCIDESLTIFSPKLVTSISDGQLKYLYSPENSNQQFVIGVDVATSGEASADFSAFIVLEVIPTENGVKKVIRHIVHVKGMAVTAFKQLDPETNQMIGIEPGQVDTIVELAARFNNALVVVEKNNVGVVLIQELQKRNVNVQEFITTKDRKEGMIRYLVNEMKNKNIWFPEETNEITRLKKELLNFGVKRNKAGKERMEALTGHDDMVMSLAMANQAANDVGSLPFAVCM